MRSGVSIGIVCAVLGTLTAAAAPVAADPLDRISGTERWGRAQERDPTAEWKAWLAARVQWRRARRWFRLERARNRRLAQLLRRGRPEKRAVQRILRSRLRRGSHDVLVPRGRGRRDLRRIKVPVERLDRKGQAIDEGGDRVLRDSRRRRRKRR